MDTTSSDKVLAFDSLFTTNHIQILKILLPYLNRHIRGKLAVYIKLLELQYTLTFFQKNPHSSLGREFSETNDFVDICNEILPFCAPSEKEKLQNIKNILYNIKNMQEIMQVMEMLQELAPELFPRESDPDHSSAAQPGTGLLDMLPGAGGMDIAQMMELLQSMFSQSDPA